MRAIVRFHSSSFSRLFGLEGNGNLVAFMKQNHQNNHPVEISPLSISIQMGEIQ